jgi:hypothetical protein
MDNASEVFSTVGGGNTLNFAQNPFDTNRAERGNSGIDFPNLLGITFIYDLPFGKSQHGFAGKVLGGWQLNTTYRYSSGQPYTTIQFNQFDLGTGNLCDPSSTMSGTYSACRPIVSNAAAPLATAGFCTDPTLSDCGISDFVTGAPTTFSAVHWILNDVNAAEFYGTPYKGGSRNTLRGQTISSANFGVFKNTKMNEKVTLQFQATAFNIMNKQFLGVPDPILDDAGSSFQNTNFNPRGGFSSTANAVYDGIGRRRLLFGLKLIF